MGKVERPKKTETKKKSNKSKETEVGVAKTRGRYKAVIIDAKKLRTITEEKGYTVSRVCEIVGIANSAYWNWEHNNGKANIDTIKRVCNLLGIDIHDVLMPTETVQTAEDVKVVSDVVSEAIESEVEENPFKEIGDTQNVHTQFDTVNTNVMVLANVLKAYIDEKFDILNAKMDILGTETHKDLSEYYQRLMLELESNRVFDASMGSGKKPQAFFINAVEATKLLTGYNENDTYERYKDKINRMVSMISSVTKTPHKNILHGFYIEMTNTYGVVYDQCKKEYFEKYQHRDNGSTELIYENPIFRQIFYNMISDELKKVTKDIK